MLTVCVETEAEIKINKNSAKNAYDQASKSNLYPHARAYVETRSEPVFAAETPATATFADYLAYLDEFDCTGDRITYNEDGTAYIRLKK